MFNAKSKSGRGNLSVDGRRRVRPGLEALEQRAMLSTTAGDRAVAAVNLAQSNRAYISNLIGTNRDLTPREEALSRRLVAALDRGASREDVVTKLLRSGLSYDAQVKSTYRGLLERAPRANEYRNAIRRLESTGDDRSLKIALLGTREFYNKRGGGTDAGFLTALYRVVLRRTPTAGEQADGLGSVSNRSARTTLARRLMNGTEARTIQIQEAYRAAGRLVTTVPSTAFQTLQQPGGLFRITAQALASQESYRRIAALGSSLGDTPAPPPPTGYPVGRGFNLNSSVQPIAVTSDFIFSNYVGMSASGDEDLWIAGEADLWTYNVQTNALTKVLPLGAAGRVLWVDAVSSTEAYAILEENSPILHVVVSSSGTKETTLPALPNNALPTQVSAAPDGTIWALAGSSQLYSYDTNTKAWSTIDTGGNSLSSLSVGSATNILAISSAGAALRYTPGTGFQPEAALAGAKIQALQATPDGAGWVFDDGIIMLKPSDGTWGIVPAAARPTSLNVINGIEPFFVAGSRNRAFMLGTTSTTAPDSNLQIDLINFGVVDRPTTTFTPYTGASLGIYQALSLAATIGFNNDIRSLYGQKGEAWSTYLSNLEGAKTPPPNVDPTLWSSVFNQLKTELTEVSAVYTRLASIAQTLIEIQTINDGQLAAVGQIAGLYVQNQPSGTILQLVLTDLFEAVLGAISSTGIAAGYATLAALIAAGADDAINSFQSSNNVGPDDAVPVAFNQLQTTLDKIFSGTITQLNTDLATIATDPLKLAAVAGKIISNEWPDPADSNIITPTTDAYNVYFYQIMVASKWQVEHSLYGDYIEYPITQILDRVPLWAIGQYPKGYYNGMPIEDVYLINQIGSTADWNSPSIEDGPFPSSALLDGINALGTTQTYAFWAGLGNWSVIKRLEASF